MCFFQRNSEKTFRKTKKENEILLDFFLLKICNWKTFSVSMERCRFSGSFHGFFWLFTVFLSFVIENSIRFCIAIRYFSYNVKTYSNLIRNIRNWNLWREKWNNCFKISYKWYYQQLPCFKAKYYHFRSYFQLIKVLCINFINSEIEENIYLVFDSKLFNLENIKLI